MKATPGRTHSIRYEESRQWALKHDIPARFDIADNPDEDGKAPLWREHDKGVEAVKKYDSIILREAQRQGVDPDLIRAIMYTENADGSRYGIEALATRLRLTRTLMPMNIDAQTWQGMNGNLPEDFRDPEKNIAASVILIERIRDRIADPTPSKIGSIWNFAGREKVNSLGARIGKAYEERLWEKHQ